MQHSRPRRRCQQLGDRFLVPMPATGPWLCLTDPEDIKRVFTADTDVLRLGAALAKASAHHLFLGPTGLTNLDGAEHMRKRRMQLPPFQGHALSGYHETMERKTEEALARWPYRRSTPSRPHMEAISLEVIMATVFGVTDPARVQRLRSATLALLREGHSRRFFLQTMIATSRENGWDRPFPRIRRAIGAVDAIVMEEVAQRRSEEELSCTAAPSSTPTRSHSAPSVSWAPAPAPTRGYPSAAGPDDASAPPSPSPRPGSCSGQSSATPASSPPTSVRSESPTATYSSYPHAAGA